MFLTKHYLGDQNKEMDRVCGMNNRGEMCIHSFGRKTKLNKPTGRTRHRLEDNTKTYAEEIRWGGINYPFISHRVGETGRFF